MPIPISGPSGPDSLFSVSSTSTEESTTFAPTGPIDTLSSSSTAPTVSTFTLSTIELEEPKVGLLPFLTMLSKMKMEHKTASADTQEYILRMNREFFLGLSQDIVNVTVLRQTVVKYYDDIDDIGNTQTALIDALNLAIDNYNTESSTTNSEIADLNAAIATFNAVDPDSPEYPAAIVAFNDAVDNFNTYVNNSGNPALADLQSAINDYNVGTAENLEAVSEFNAWVDEKNEEPGFAFEYYPFTFASAPSGAVDSLDNYPNHPAAGTPPSVPSYTPTSITTLGFLGPIPVLTRDVIGLLLPVVAQQLAALILMRLIFRDLGDYNAFLAFVLKTGTTLTPAALTAYLANNEKPALNSTGSTIGAQGSSVGLGSSVIGLDSPFLEGELSNSLYDASMEKFDRQVAQSFIDQANMLNDQIFSTAGQKAGFSAVETAGEKAETVSGTVLETLVTALFLQELLDIIKTSGDTLKPSLEQLLTENGVPPKDIAAVLDQLSNAQGLALSLQGALAVGLATGDTGFVGNLLNSIPSISNVASQVSSAPPPNLFSAFTDPVNQLIVKISLNQELLNDSTLAADDARLALLNEAVDTTIAQNTQNTSSENFRSSLEQNLSASGFTSAQTAQIAARAFDLAQGLTTPRTTTPSSTADLAASVTNVLNEKLAPLGPEIAKEVAERIGKLIYDPTNPANTLSKLIENYINTQTKISDKARDDVVKELLAVVPPAELQVIKPAILLLQLLDPAYNISKSFGTGIMYDKALPTNMKRPIDMMA